MDIPENTPITREMLTTKGPGNGINPMKMNDIIGKTMKTNIAEDMVIKEEDINW